MRFAPLFEKRRRRQSRSLLERAMGIDLLVHLPCKVKEALGNGEQLEGAERLIQLTKKRHQALYWSESLASKGIPLSQQVVTHVLRTPEGDRRQEIRVADMIAETDVLLPHGHHCAYCPARVETNDFGCCAYVNYPISIASEAWLLRQLQSPQQIGGFLCFRAIQDFSYTGAPMATMRSMNGAIFENAEPQRRKFATGEEVNTDQLFHALFHVGPVSPPHAMSLLLWFGFLSVDGRIPKRIDPDAFSEIYKLAPADRMRRTKVHFAEEPPDSVFGHLFFALHAAWIVDETLYIDV